MERASKDLHLCISRFIKFDLEVEILAFEIYAPVGQALVLRQSPVRFPGGIFQLLYCSRL